MEPFLSVIIPVRHGNVAQEVLRSLNNIDYPRDRIEVLIVEGTQPSKQRNEAVRHAQGDIVYFLDDDSVIYPNLFRDVLKWFCDDRIVAVGGPAVTRKTDSFLQKCFGYALGAYFGSLGMSYKFKAYGWVKEATERDLILANLAMRRNVFLAAGGLNEELYPNEENELLNRLKCQGYRFIYNAEAVVYRSQRESLAKFMRQLFHYGRGRMEHFFVNPSFFAPIFMAPLIFVVYLCSLPLSPGCWYFIPLGLYASLSLSQSALIALEQREWRCLLVVPLLFPLMHISYGCGLAWSILRRVLHRSLVASRGEVLRVYRIALSEAGLGQGSVKGEELYKQGTPTGSLEPKGT
jgi:succinoglycan biosynthesis protein ExoA